MGCVCIHQSTLTWSGFLFIRMHLFRSATHIIFLKKSPSPLSNCRAPAAEQLNLRPVSNHVSWTVRVVRSVPVGAYPEEGAWRQFVLSHHVIFGKGFELVCKLGLVFCVFMGSSVYWVELYRNIMTRNGNKLKKPQLPRGDTLVHLCGVRWSNLLYALSRRTNEGSAEISRKV